MVDCNYTNLDGGGVPLGSPSLDAQVVTMRSTLEWIVYDGNRDTLPQTGKQVLLVVSEAHEKVVWPAFCEVYHDGSGRRAVWRDNLGVFRYSATEGDTWARWPSPPSMNSGTDPEISTLEKIADITRSILVGDGSKVSRQRWMEDYVTSMREIGYDIYPGVSVEEAVRKLMYDHPYNFKLERVANLAHQYVMNGGEEVISTLVEALDEIGRTTKK